MSSKPFLLQLLAIPVMLLLICNFITLAFVTLLASGLITFTSPLYYLGVVLTLTYGMWLRLQNRWGSGWPKTAKRQFWWVVLGVAVLGTGWASVAWGLWSWVTGAVVLFALQRTIMRRFEGTQKGAKGDWLFFVRCFLWTLAGFGTALFLAPFGITLAVASFLLVQWVFELRIPDISPESATDRFAQSLKVARAVLAKGQL